ncbi:MAG: hypothetical protein SGJ21_02455 [Alphaproteobacteria bacterium]|nr:hypothetical protein [Alphaproteobacteria bacterium]
MPVVKTSHALFAALALPAFVVSGCVAAKPNSGELAMVAAAQAPLLPATREERDAADRQELLAQAAFWGKEYEKNPNDNEAALKLARVLRAIGSSQRASEIASQSLAMKPGDVEFTLVLAQASLDQGRPDIAAGALALAERAGLGDWRMMSTIGVTMDQLDRHVDAQDYYRRALILSPANPKILSNLGLSYALSSQPLLAEETLRQAIESPEADARVRQNLVLVLGVQGKFAEAETAAGHETPKELIDSNSAYFRGLLSASRNWENLRGSRN